MNFDNYAGWMDKSTQAVLNLRDNPKKIDDLFSEEQKKQFIDSKIGYIKIQKISDNYGYIAQNGCFEGVTSCFGEGFGVIITNAERWFRTSVIKDIKEFEFDTLNSTYKYEFTEISLDNLKKELDDFSKKHKIAIVND